MPQPISIIAEHHDNLSGIQELLNQAREAPAGSTVLLEMQAVMNGPIEAFYRGEYSQQQLADIFSGYYFEQYQDRGDDMAAAVAELRELGIQAIAYDSRSIVESREHGHDALDFYSERNNRMLIQEMSAFDMRINDLQARAADLPADSDERQNYIDEIASLQMDRTARGNAIRASIYAIEDTLANSEYFPQIEQITEATSASGTDNPDIITAQVIDRFQGEQTLVFLGEVHVSGQVIEGLNQRAYGIVDEALEALGHEVRIVSVRASLDDFVYGHDDLNALNHVTREDYAHIVVDEHTGERGPRFESQAELQQAVLASADAELTAAITSGEMRVGVVDASDRLPEATQHDQFAALLAGMSFSAPMNVQDVGTQQPEGMQAAGAAREREQGAAAGI